MDIRLIVGQYKHTKKTFGYKACPGKSMLAAGKF